MWQYPQTEMSCKTKRKKVKVPEFMYRDTTNVEPEMYDYTNNAWSHWNSNEKLRESLENIPRKYSTDPLQKTATLGISHIIRKVLQSETWRLSGGDHCWIKRSTKKKRPVTRDHNTNNNSNNKGEEVLLQAWSGPEGSRKLRFPDFTEKF